MSKPTSPKVIYRVPEAIVLDKFARAVCQRIAERGQPDFQQHEIWRGLAQFLKIVVQMQVAHLNKKRSHKPVIKEKAHAKP